MQSLDLTGFSFLIHVFVSFLSPKKAAASHHLARVDNTRQNILKSRKSHKRMNESQAKPVNYHQGLSLNSQIIPPRMYYCYLIFLALLSHICVSLNVSCFLSQLCFFLDCGNKPFRTHLCEFHNIPVICFFITRLMSVINRTVDLHLAREMRFGT